ncbi:MAG: hypothetical protein M3328_11515 [Chloroflexota bacterium]|nr:hypothetical protein [Chloroflexota bacterium]
MDNNLLLALLGIAGTLLGIIVTRFFDWLDRRSKHQQWLDEFRLPKQLDTLSTLYADAVQLHTQLAGIGGLFVAGVTGEEIDEARAVYDNYARSSALAYIYLSKEARHTNDMFKSRSFYLINSLRLDNLSRSLPEPSPFLTDEKFKESKNQTNEQYERLVRLLQQELVATSTPVTKRKSM